MNSLLRKICRCNRRHLLRIVTFGTVGSGLLFANIDADSVRARIAGALPYKLPLPYGVTPDYFGIGSTVGVNDKNSVSMEVGSSSEKSAAMVAAKVSPAVVNIVVPWRIGGKAIETSTGCGTIIHSDGTILTCAHLVTDNRGRTITSQGKVHVTLQDGRVFVGIVLFSDLHYDIAIVKIESDVPLPVAKLGTSAALRLGDPVVSIGSPRSLASTVTAGVVSYLDRKTSDTGFGGMLRTYIQTDCTINKGNSGGPLINLDCEVVGVNIKSVVDAIGLNLAVPIDSVAKIMEYFKKDGRVIRPWIGVKMLDLNEMIIAQLRQIDRTFPNVKRGILIAMVTPGSPADSAGFRLGDVVIEFDGKPVGKVSEIVELMEGKRGVPLKAVVQRAGNILVTLTVLPKGGFTSCLQRLMSVQSFFSNPSKAQNRVSSSIDTLQSYCWFVQESLPTADVSTTEVAVLLDQLLY